MAGGELSVLLFKCRLVKDGICDGYHLSQDLKEVRQQFMLTSGEEHCRAVWS